MFFFQLSVSITLPVGSRTACLLLPPVRRGSATSSLQQQQRDPSICIKLWYTLRHRWWWFAFGCHTTITTTTTTQWQTDFWVNRFCHFSCLGQNDCRVSATLHETVLNVAELNHRQKRASYLHATVLSCLPKRTLLAILSDTHLHPWPHEPWPESGMGSMRWWRSSGYGTPVEWSSAATHHSLRV